MTMQRLLITAAAALVVAAPLVAQTSSGSTSGGSGGTGGSSSMGSGSSMGTGGGVPTGRRRLTLAGRDARAPAMTIHIIGGGLAGSEAAWQAARAGIPVILHEMRGVEGTAAHHTDKLAELVCSNSFRSDDPENN